MGIKGMKLKGHVIWMAEIRMRIRFWSESLKGRGAWKI
jgi:hypothetical protein